MNKPASMDVARKLFPQDEIALNSSLVVPLLLDGRTVGTISVYCCTQHFYTGEHLRLLTIVADHAVTAIDNARCFEQTRELAMTDALTGLPNGRSLASRLAAEIQTARRDAETVALVLIDLDDFKEINDRFGHVAGDRALRDVAEILSRQAPPGAFVSRYAGDEFVIVLPGATCDRARLVAHTIQETLAREGWAGIYGADAYCGVSVGVACFPEDGPDARALIHYADRGMYRDKFDRKRARSEMSLPGEIFPQVPVAVER
jgi:diguanylate cyclase (GGDEF)-like protein